MRRVYRTLIEVVPEQRRAVVEEDVGVPASTQAGDGLSLELLSFRAGLQCLRIHEIAGGQPSPPATAACTFAGLYLRGRFGIHPSGIYSPGIDPPGFDSPDFGLS